MVWGLDVATGEVVTVTVPGGTPLAVEGNLLWGVTRNTLWAVDLSSLTLAFEFPGGESIYRFLDVGAADNGVIWLAAQAYFGNEIKTVLLSVDTTTHAITRRIVIGPSPNRVAVGEGAIWVTDFDQSVLLKIVP